MIIASWNCNMAFRKKISYISQFKPDVLIIQECENPERLQLEGFPCPEENVLWFGNNESKGIGIFSFTNYKFKLHEKYNEAFKYVIPISVSGPDNFILFAIWAMDDKVNRQNQYIGQVWHAISYYKNEIGRDTVLVGDFNSNAIWDHPKNNVNYSDVVNFLKEKKIISAYHHYFNENHGQESQPTLYMYRKQDRPYHIDYCFLSEELIALITKVTVGEYASWISASDHMPLIVELNMQLKN